MVDKKHCPGCAELADYICEYVDQTLDEALAKKLHGHVSHCPQCQSLENAERHLRQLIRRSCHTAAPASLRQRIHSSLQVLSVQTESVSVTVASEGVVARVRSTKTTICRHPLSGGQQF